VEKAVEMGCFDGAAVRYLMQADQLNHDRVEPVVVAGLERYDRPQPQMTSYDRLLGIDQQKEVLQ